MADPTKVIKGGLSAVRNASRAADQALEAKRLALEAANPPIKASEAYGQHEGAYMKPIFYDRMKVDLSQGKKGGPGFSGIQLVDPNYANAKAVAGVTDQKMATRILNRNKAGVPAGAKVIWTPSVGGLEQHKSNSTMFGQFADIFANQRKNMTPEEIQKLSDRASNAVDNKGKLIFPNGIDLGSRNFRQKVTTYDQRALMADIFAGRGVGGEKGRTVPVEELLEKNLDPNVASAGTLDLGNRLFRLEGDVIDRPDLHTDYRKILTGEDLGVNYIPVPIRDVYTDWEAQKALDLIAQGKNRGVTLMDYTKNDPTIQLTEELLTRMQKAGKKKGGAVHREESPEDMAEFQKRFALHKATGGSVNIPRLSLKGGKHMVDGGKIGKGLMGAINKASKLADQDIAAQAIGKAAESAGMTAPVTANKPLTGLQDFHTSLGDEIRRRATEAKKQMDAWDYKYDKGQRVFTEDSAKKNRAPYEIIERTRYGNQLIRENDNPIGKVLRDEEGKARRTPYEPGYRVRGEIGEMILPESAIKGDVEMAKGGLLRMVDGGKIAKGLMGAVNKAAKAVDAEAAGAKTLNAAEREANKAKFLEPSAVKEKLFRGNRRAPKADKFVTTQDRATPSFTNDPEVANVYSQQLGWDIAHGPGSTSVPVYIQSEKPFDVRPLGEHITLDEIIDRMNHDFTVPRHPTKLGYEDLADILGTLDHHAQKGNAKQNIDAIDKRGTFRIRNFSQLADEISHAGSKKDIDRILYDLLPEASIDTYALADSHEMVNQLKKQGFDSMIHKDVFDAGMPYYKGNPSKIEEGFDSDYVIDAFRPFNQNKIKSAIGNRGTYDVTDPDITKAKGGAVGHESLKELEHFHKRFALHKATGGKINIPHLSLKKPKKFDGGGIAAADVGTGVEDKGVTKAGLMTEYLAKAAKEQGKEELSSLNKPRAATDLLNRGVLANNPLSAMVDLVNMGLVPLDVLGSKLTGRDIKVSSEKPFLGAEYVKDLMNQYGVTSGEERPMMETALSFASPTAMIKGAMKATDTAKKAPELIKKASDAFTSSKLPPLATEAKTASAGKPTGATYATKQEGPFFRVSPTTLDTSKAKTRGIREADELQGQAPLGGGAGSTGSQVPTRLADEEVARIIADPVANEPLNIAKKYTQETQGADFVLPDIPESSLVKQSAIGRAQQLAVDGSPEYKSAVFDAYAQQMPDVLERAGAKNYDDLMEKAYRQLAKETDAQFQALPYNFSYHRAGEGNYNSSKEMAADVHGNKHLYVYQGGDKHDFLNRIDPASGLNENEKFRAVHDLLGHAIYGNQFGPKGEEMAWAVHSQMYSPLARLAMTAETRGQNSMVNYSPLNANLKAELAKYDSMANEARRKGDKALLNEINAAKRQAYAGFEFAPNKAVLLPPEFLSPKYTGGMPSYLEAANRPVKGTETQSVLTHFSNDPNLQMLDPKRYGSGIKGAEAERLRDYPGAVRDRSYFYMGEPGTVAPEAGLGVNRYRGEASSLYDITQDPLNFQRLARESNRTPFTAKYNQGMTYPLQDANDVERLVKEYGYQGMANPKATKPMAIMFKETPVRRQARGGLTLMK